MSQSRELKNLEKQFQSPSKDDGSLWELCLFVIFFVLVFSAIARADGSKVAKIEAQSSAKPSAFKYSSTLTVETSKTLGATESESYGGWYQLILGAKYKPSKISASLINGFAQEYSYEREDGTVNAFDNPILSVSKTMDEGEEFRSTLLDSIAFGLRGSLPANREAYKKTFQGSLGAQTVLKRALGRFDLSQTLRYTRSFYEYDMASDGRVNAPDTFTSISDVTLNVTDAFTLGVNLLYAYSVSYQGVGRANQIASISGEYAFTNNMSVSAGVATERGTLDADGQTNSIRFFDENVSQVFVDLIIQI